MWENFTADSYVNNPLSVQFDADIMTDEVINCFVKTAGAACRFYPVRVKRINKLVSCLNAQGKIKSFTFNVIRTLKPLAYMRDGGGIYMSRGLMLRTSPVSFLSDFCHELAHIWLSGQPYYARLKQVNASFIAVACDICGAERANLMSPVELYAMVISVSFMRQIAAALSPKKAKKLLVRAQDIQSKINLLLNEINCLQKQSFVV